MLWWDQCATGEETSWEAEGLRGAMWEVIILLHLFLFSYGFFVIYLEGVELWYLFNDFLKLPKCENGWKAQV